MAQVFSRYDDNTLAVDFEGTLEKHEEGNEVTNITVSSITLLGYPINFLSLSAELQSEIIALADEFEDEEDAPSFDDDRETEGLDE